MEKRQLIFRPTDQEEQFIQDNNIQWSEYCHKHLEHDIRNKKYVHLEKLQLSLLCIIFGVFIIAIMIYLIPFINIFFATFLYISSGICIGIGTIIILREVIHTKYG